MFELSSLSTALRGFTVLYWLLTAGAVALAIWKGRTWLSKSAWVLAAIAVFGFLPAKAAIEQAQRDDYKREAWAYFKKKCETEAGEKIYKTFTGVKSVLVIKPLPPATDADHFDQFWYGDPYSASAHSQRGRAEAAILASPNAPASFGKAGRGYDFVESVIVATEGPEKKLVKYSYAKGARDHTQEPLERQVSQFGVSWEDISTPEDRRYWVAGSRLRIIDLTNNSVVAERIGYFLEAGFGSRSGGRRPWLTSRGPNTTCPAIRNGNFEDRWFLLKVLSPIGDGDAK